MLQDTSFSFVCLFLFLLKPLPFTCAARDPGEMSVPLGTDVLKVYLLLRSPTCSLTQNDEETSPLPPP